MFDSENGDFDIQKSHINGIGEYVITAGVTNNGILGKTNISAKVIDGGTITIDMFGNSFYRYFKYKMVTHARVFSLIPKFDMNKEQGLYIVNSFKYLIFEFGYENMCSWAKIQNKKIQLPTKDGKIDFEFMECFIAELEAQHIAELEAYLKATGLNNYELTSDEKKSFDNFNNIKWGEYRIGDLFEVSVSKGYDAGKMIFLDKTSYTFEFVGRTKNNYGIQGYVEKLDTEPNDSETISISQIGTVNAQIRKNKWYSSQNIFILKPFNKKLVNLAIIAFINKKLSKYKGYSSYPTLKIKLSNSLQKTEK